MGCGPVDGLLLDSGPQMTYVHRRSRWRISYSMMEASISSPGAHIRVCTPVLNQSGGIDTISLSVCLFHFEDGEPRRQLVLARYLVHSRGLLLMVVRYGQCLKYRAKILRGWYL